MKTLFEVITDYGNYPGFDPSVTGVTVLGQDESGAHGAEPIRHPTGGGHTFTS